MIRKHHILLIILPFLVFIISAAFVIQSSGIEAQTFSDPLVFITVSSGSSYSLTGNAGAQTFTLFSGTATFIADVSSVYPNLAVEIKKSGYN